MTRHVKRVGAEEAVRRDVAEECRRARLPNPCSIESRSVAGVPGVGLVARVVLGFAAPVPGPIVLGRSRHRGGGMFAATTRAR